MKTYSCKKCQEEWSFEPSDYKYQKKHYPIICPHCSMPVIQMLRDVYEQEGLVEAIKQLLRRYL